jgi:hypothetical protein
MYLFLLSFSSLLIFKIQAANPAILNNQEERNPWREQALSPPSSVTLVCFESLFPPFIDLSFPLVYE